MEHLTIQEREKAVARFGSETFPSCDAFESGCTCDLCLADELLVSQMSAQADDHEM